MRPVRVSEVQFLGGRVLRVTFTDGLVRELDFSGTLVGVLALIDDDDVFQAAAVDPVSGTISWERGIHLDPDVLHGSAQPASGLGPRVIREHHREPSR